MRNALLNRYENLLASRQYQGCLEFTKRGLKEDPRDIQAMACVAEANEYMNHFAVAMECIDRALGEEPLNVESIKLKS